MATNSAPSKSSRVVLVLVAAAAGLVTLVWFAFLVWLVLKALSLL